MKTILSLFVTLILLSGCKTKEMIRYVPINNTITRIDSFTTHKTDSFIQFQKGDTIYRDRWRTLFKQQIKIKSDSIYIPYEVRVDVPVDKVVIKYKHDTIWWIGLIVSIGGLLFLLYKIIK
jgi:hypothetical protein